MRYLLFLRFTGTLINARNDIRRCGCAVLPAGERAHAPQHSGGKRRKV